jgi:NAD(P)-dependent dehydrogenase (short-subunit alcohol dehydrogenase family)
MLDSNRLDGKVALVTGAGGEIGAATVKLMIVRGARIVRSIGTRRPCRSSSGSDVGPT